MTTLTEIHGISTVLDAKLLGHVGDITRFPSADHFAGYTGTAPLAASSGERTRHRLNTGGNGNSIPCCTPSPSAKPAIPGRVASTTSANSTRVRPRPKPDEHSNAASPTSSIAECAEINEIRYLRLLDTQRRYQPRRAGHGPWKMTRSAEPTEAVGSRRTCQ
nr:transposase [Rhodococcus pyridinivorans]